LQGEEAEFKMEEKLIEQAQETEISENVYERKYKEIDNAYWEVQKSIQDEIDFGIIILDLSNFKRKLVTKLQDLRAKL